mgnify:CR=1 FL=1
MATSSNSTRIALVTGGMGGIGTAISQRLHQAGRGDVIGGGALVWRRVLQRIAEATDGRVSTATTSEHDILDGIALSRLSTIPQKAPLA